MAMVDQALAPVGGRVVLQVYDEIVSTVPREYAEWAADIVEYCMKEAAKTVLETVPVEVDCVISHSWAEDDLAVV